MSQNSLRVMVTRHPFERLAENNNTDNDENDNNNNNNNNYNNNNNNDDNNGNVEGARVSSWPHCADPAVES